MKDFAAIDFETANEERSSVCSVGIVIVKDGKIADSFYSLINPIPNYYEDWMTDIHGITKTDTENELTFPEVWAKITGRIEGLTLVAHNSPFDEDCLKAVFSAYGMDYPGYKFRCTLRASREKLDIPCHQLQYSAAACGYNLKNHHNALSDAEACAAIALRLL